MVVRRGKTGPWRSLGAAVVGLMLFGFGCDGSVAEGSEGASMAGLYLGTDVSFRVEEGLAFEFRFSNIECRLPHPDNAQIALCLNRPEGRPEATLALSGGRLSGQVGDLFIDGTIQGDEASGLWRYSSLCFDGSTCESEGTWNATYKEESGGAQPSPIPDPGEPSSPVGNATDSESSDSSAGAPGAVSADANASQLSAWDAFEAVRLEAGIGMPGQDDALNAAAQAHADYFALHAEKYQETGLNPHEENAEWSEGFSGVGIGDRLAFHGASGGMGWGEVMAFTGSAEGAVAGWMATLYHRIPFVHPNTSAWGFGIASGETRCEVMDYSIGAAMASGSTRWESAGQAGVPWPVPGATGVDTSWNGAESPQPPLPEGESYPSGPVITLTFESGSSLSLTSATLSGPEGEVPSQVQTPDNDPWLSTSWSLYAYDPLAPQSTYTVAVEGTLNGAPYIANWSFETR